MVQEHIVSIAELQYVEVHCQYCPTRVILDMKQLSKLAEGNFCPKQCPGCLKDYDSAIRPNVDAFQRAYEKLLQVTDRVRFRISAH